ncbi:MAG: ATP-binding cassette domain-containing protein [Anaerolineales bacterium]
MNSAISVRNLSKTYIVHERSGGLRAALRGVFRREKKEVEAVKSINFEIEPGEIIGFLGPNGAGKTTTLKMLSGLLHPTGGQALVLGYEPHEREKDFLRQITLVTGQRNQLIWDIPAIDSFEVNQAIYDLDREQFKRTVDEYIEILELQELVRKPVRQLSLLRLGLTFVVPVAFAVTVPAQALTDRLSLPILLMALFVTVLALGASRWFWFRGLKSYAGASA